jgi:hypothetical protein
MKVEWGVGVVEKETGPAGPFEYSVVLSAEPYVVVVSIACLRCFTEARA